MGRGGHISICRLGKPGALLSQLRPSPSPRGLVSEGPGPVPTPFSLRFFLALNALCLLPGWECAVAPLETCPLLIFFTLAVTRSFFYALGANGPSETWTPALGWGGGKEDFLPSVQEEVEGWRAACQGHPAPSDRASRGMKCLDLGFCSKSRAPCRL